jgi:hypothetical protein
MGIRDIHLFDEKMESAYFRNVCTSNQCVYSALPIVDGCLWSTARDMASLRFFALDGGGRITELRGGEPEFVQKKGCMVVRWPLKDHQGVITVSLSEGMLSATCSAKSLHWLMQLNVQPQARLPFQNVGGHELTASLSGFPYRLTLRSGLFEDMRQMMGCAFRIYPEKGRVEMNMKPE